MLINLGRFPIALLLIAFLLPLIYSLLYYKEKIKDITIIYLMGLLIVALYPITELLGEYFPEVGYALGKIIIFIIIPTFFIFTLENWTFEKILNVVGIKSTNLSKSIYLGMMAAVLTVFITIVVTSRSPEFDFLWGIISFFEAVTEEYLFRGVLLLYLAYKLDIKIAYATSIIGFILVHPQHFNSLFIISTASQALILAYVARKTENIIGTWLSHGLNRIIPSIIRTFII